LLSALIFVSVRSGYNLIIEPKSSHSIKAIYRVLKFALKHKSPVNRSALTYWEDNIPSRLDLAKSRYGGLFSTEYVENVKTFLKLLLFCFPVLPSVGVFGSMLSSLSGDSRSNHSASKLWFISYPLMPIFFTVILYEFLLFPFTKSCKKLSMLQRLCLVVFVSMLLCLSILLWDIVDLKVSISQNAKYFFRVALWCVLPSLIFDYVLSVIQFVCAQSPYNMRALLLSYVVIIILFGSGIGGSFYLLFRQFCTSDYCDIVRDSVSLVVSLIGFILNCEFAKRYVLRRRDDIEHVQFWVESYYDKILP